LRTRYELVKEAENNLRSNARSLAENFETQVYSILKERLQSFSNMKVMHLVVHAILYSEVDDVGMATVYKLLLIYIHIACQFIHRIIKV